MEEACMQKRGGGRLEYSRDDKGRGCQGQRSRSRSSRASFKKVLITSPPPSCVISFSPPSCTLHHHHHQHHHHHHHHYRSEAPTHVTFGTHSRTTSYSHLNVQSSTVFLAERERDTHTPNPLQGRHRYLPRAFVKSSIASHDFAAIDESGARHPFGLNEVSLTWPASPRRWDSRVSMGEPGRDLMLSVSLWSLFATRGPGYRQKLPFHLTFATPHGCGV